MRSVEVPRSGVRSEPILSDTVERDQPDIADRLRAPVRVMCYVSKATEDQLADHDPIVLLHDRTRRWEPCQPLDDLTNAFEEVLGALRLPLGRKPGPVTADVLDEALVEADAPPRLQRVRVPGPRCRTTGASPDPRSLSEDSRAVPSRMVWANAHERARCHSCARDNRPSSSSSSRRAIASARKPVASGTPVLFAYRSRRVRISGLTGTLSGRFLRLAGFPIGAPPCSGKSYIRVSVLLSTAAAQVAIRTASR